MSGLWQNDFGLTDLRHVSCGQERHQIRFCSTRNNEANAVFAVFSAAVVAVFAGWFVVNAPRIDALAKSALVLIISGATGNLIDRLVSGRVTDFLDFFAGGYHWPSFNAADSCISVGGALLFIWAVKSDRSSGGKNAADNN